MHRILNAEPTITYWSTCIPTDARAFTKGSVSTASNMIFNSSSPVDAVPNTLDPEPPEIISLKGANWSDPGLGTDAARGDGDVSLSLGGSLDGDEALELSDMVPARGSTSGEPAVPR